MKPLSLFLILLGFGFHSAYCDPAAPPSDSTSIAGIDSVRTPESIHLTINANIKSLSKLRKTFEKSSPCHKDGTKLGRLHLRLGIAASGIVVENRIISSTTEIPEFDEAVRDTVFTWRFKPVRQKEAVSVNMPFDFSKNASGCKSVSDSSSK